MAHYTPTAEEKEPRIYEAINPRANKEVLASEEYLHFNDSCDAIPTILIIVTVQGHRWQYWMIG